MFIICLCLFTPKNLECFAASTAYYSVSTVAGSTSGITGDGGKATSAKLKSPYGIYVDNSNIIYIADGGNERIRRVNTTSSIITLFAGSTQGNNLGDGAATSTQFDTPRAVAKDAAGNVYVVDSVNDDIRKITTTNIISSFIASSNYFLFFYY